MLPSVYDQAEMSEHGIPETIGRVYSDGHESHVVLVGEDRTICGEFTPAELLEDVPADEPLCAACDKRERWERAGG